MNPLQYWLFAPKKAKADASPWPGHREEPCAAQPPGSGPGAFPSARSASCRNEHLGGLTSDITACLLGPTPTAFVQRRLPGLGYDIDNGGQNVESSLGKPRSVPPTARGPHVGTPHPSCPQQEFLWGVTGSHTSRLHSNKGRSRTQTSELVARQGVRIDSGPSPPQRGPRTPGASGKPGSGRVPPWSVL